MLYLFLRRILVGPLIGMIFRPWVKGLENIPEDGPALLVSNHLAFCDSVFLPVAVPRQIHFPAKAEYFTAPGFKGKVVAAFFRAVGQVPIDRSGGRASMAALDTGIRILSEGKLFGIYPEGTRSPDGRLYKGRTGVADRDRGRCPGDPGRDDRHRQAAAARPRLAALAGPRAWSPAPADHPSRRW